jgi:hypothetical protein
MDFIRAALNPIRRVSKRDSREDTMSSEFWQPPLRSMAEEHVEELRVAAKSSLERPAVIWRGRTGEEPIFVRLLNDSEYGVTFMCPVPLEAGEDIEFSKALDDAARRTLHVARCEHLEEDAYRVGAHV